MSGFDLILLFQAQEKDLINYLSINIVIVKNSKSDHVFKVVVQK